MAVFWQKRSNNDNHKLKSCVCLCVQRERGHLDSIHSAAMWEATAHSLLIDAFNNLPVCGHQWLKFVAFLARPISRTAGRGHSELINSSTIRLDFCTRRDSFHFRLQSPKDTCVERVLCTAFCAPFLSFLLTLTWWFLKFWDLQLLTKEGVK